MELGNIRNKTVVLLLTILHSGCSGSGGSSSYSDGEGSGASGGDVVITGSLAIDASVPAITADSSMMLGNKEVSVKDSSGNTIAKTISSPDGSYVVSAPGALMFGAGTDSLTNVASLNLAGSGVTLESIVADTKDGSVVGIKEPLDLTKASGRALQLGQTDLKKITAIRGRAVLEGIKDNTGISVYVPGTSYQARTDSGGTFLMTFLPAGTYDLRFERDGFLAMEVKAINVTENETSIVESVSLKMSGGATDIKATQIGTPGISQSRKVEFEINPGSADRFKGGLQSDLENLPYGPVPATFAYEFAQDGFYVIKLQFANADGFETTLERAIYIDTVDPVASNIRLADRTEFTTSHTNERFVVATESTCDDIDSVAILPESASGVTPNDFTYDCVKTGARGAAFQLPISSGAYNYKIWVKDVVGRISTSPYIGAISLDQTSPSQLAFKITDQTSGLESGTDITTVDITLTSCDDVAFFHVSETATLPPETSQITTPCTTTPNSTQLTFANNNPGTKTVYGWAKDAAGNVSQLASVKTIVLDATAPSNSPGFGVADPTPSTAGFSNTLQLNVTGLSCSADAVKVLISETHSTRPSESVSGWIDCSSSGLQVTANDTGFRTFYLWAMDVGGNVALNSQSASITINIGPPNVPDYRLADGSETGSYALTGYTNDSTVNIKLLNSGSECDSSGSNSAYYLYWTENSSTTPPSAGAFNNANCATNAGQISFASSSEGVKTVYLWAMDRSGNISTTYRSKTITLDSTPPALPSTFAVRDSTSSSTTYTNDSNVDIVVTGCEANTFIFASESTFGASTPAETQLTTECGASASAYLGSTYQQGAKTFALWSRDRAGNISTGYLTANIGFDSVSPSSTTITVRDADGSSNYDVAPNTLTYTNQVGVALTIASCNDYAKVLVTTSSSATESSINSNCSTSAANYPLNLADSDGQQYVYLHAKDQAGNITIMSKAITLDRSAPTITSSSFILNEINTDKALFSWTSTSGNPIYTQLKWGADINSLTNSYVGTSSTTSHSLTVSSAAPVSSALTPDSSYVFSARALDHALNEGTHINLDIKTPDLYRFVPSTTGLALGTAFYEGASGDGRRRLRSCDLNGDGFEDLLVASPSTDFSSRTDAGVIYVAFGSASPSSTLGTARDPVSAASVTIGGSDASANIGSAMLCADVTGSAAKELILMDRNEKIWILTTSTYSGTVNLSDSNAAWISFSTGLSQLDDIAVGDLNGDGKSDIIGCGVGSTTNTCRGWLGGGNLNDAALTTHDLIINASDIGYTIGRSVSTGDVNGDNYDDIIVSGFFHANWYGAFHVYTGAATLPSLPTAMTRKWTVFGIAESLIDLALVTTGDLDSDGYDDIVVATSGNSHNGATVAIVYGQTDDDWNADTSAGDGNPEMTLTGSDRLLRAPGLGSNGNVGGNLGFLLIADATGDGSADLIVGGPNYNPRNGNNSGIVCVFANQNRSAWSAMQSVSNSGFASTIAHADVCVYGSRADAQLGQNIAVGNFMGTGDSNKPELIFAEPNFDATTSGSTADHGNISVLKWTLPTQHAAPLIFDLGPRYPQL
jgi:hypothetical protein